MRRSSRTGSSLEITVSIAQDATAAAIIAPVHCPPKRSAHNCIFLGLKKIIICNIIILFTNNK